MAECRDFFEEPTSGSRRSSSFVHKPTSPADVDEMDEQCLELTLGLGTTVGASCPLQVRPVSVHNCSLRQASGSFDFSAPFVPTPDLSQTPLSEKDAPKSLQNFLGEADGTVSAKQTSGNFPFSGTLTLSSFGGQADVGSAPEAPLSSGDVPFPSRDEIWLNLQKNGAVFGQDAHDAHEASSVWGRRSTSMHVIVPCKDVVDAQNDQIRRSRSSGIFPPTVSRRISSIESSCEKSPEKSIVCSQEHDQEAFEDLRKRKELQAQRRQVARKRRRIVTEEKQQKRNKQSSNLQGLGSTQSDSTNDKLSLGGGAHTSEDGAPQVLHCAAPDGLEHEGQGKGTKGTGLVQNPHAEETKQENLSQCAIVDKVDALAGSVDTIQSKGSFLMHGCNATCSASNKDRESNRLSCERNSGSLCSLMSTEFDQRASASNKFINTGNVHIYGGSLHNSHIVVATNGHTGAHMKEDEGGKSSETECVESSSLQSTGKLQQCTEEKGGSGLIVSAPLSTAPLSSNPISYPAFPFLAVPYPYTIAAATSTAIPMQAGLPVPFLVQYPTHCDNSTSPLHGTYPVVSGVTSAIALQGALMSKASSASKDCKGESFEGKGGCGEKSAFSPLPSTALNLKHVKESQCLGGQLEMQATFPVSQLSSISSVVSDACNSKSLSLDRQQSVAFEGRLLPQSSNALDLSTLGRKHEGTALSQGGIDMQHESSTSRVAEVKQAERESVEGNVESQLGSELSGVDASSVQSATVERQKSLSFSDLPWVTTTGKGPNGKTINGVLYIVNGQHVRLICSCHGKHMSPAEFVEHSGSTDLSNPERSIVVCPVPSLNHHTASAAV